MSCEPYEQLLRERTALLRRLSQVGRAIASSLPDIPAAK